MSGQSAATWMAPTLCTLSHPATCTGRHRVSRPMPPAVLVTTGSASQGRSSSRPREVSRRHVREALRAARPGTLTPRRSRAESSPGRSTTTAAVDSGAQLWAPGCMAPTESCNRNVPSRIDPRVAPTQQGSDLPAAAHTRKRVVEARIDSHWKRTVAERIRRTEA